MNKGSYQRRLIIDRKQNANETLWDFSIQIHIQNLLLRSVAAGGKVLDADGADIAFYASDGQTRLAAAIRAYDPYTGTLEAWVKIPELSAHTTELYLRCSDSPEHSFAMATFDVLCRVRRLAR